MTTSPPSPDLPIRFWQAIAVQRSDSSAERVDTRGGRLVVTDAARDAVGRVCREHGRQALLLGGPGGAVCLPLSLYTPSALDLIIGHIAVPSYVDARRLRFCRRHPRGSRRDSTMQAATAASALAGPPRAGTCTAHRGGAAMTAAMLPQVAARVSRGLHHEFAGGLAEPVITARAGHGRRPLTGRSTATSRRRPPGWPPRG